MFVWLRRSACNEPVYCQQRPQREIVRALRPPVAERRRANGTWPTGGVAAPNALAAGARLTAAAARVRAMPHPQSVGLAWRWRAPTGKPCACSRRRKKRPEAPLEARPGGRPCRQATRRRRPVPAASGLGQGRPVRAGRPDPVAMLVAYKAARGHVNVPRDDGGPRGPREDCAARACCLRPLEERACLPRGAALHLDPKSRGDDFRCHRYVVRRLRAGSSGRTTARPSAPATQEPPGDAGGGRPDDGRRRRGVLLEPGWDALVALAARL